MLIAVIKSAAVAELSCKTKAGANVAAPSKQYAAARKPATGAKLKAPPIARIYWLQAIVLLLVFLLLLLIDTAIAWSALYGGLISLLPNAYFAKWAFKYSGAKSARPVTQSFYRGEAGKFVLTTLLFAGGFYLITPLDVVALFLSYIAMMAINWIVAARYLNR